MHPLRFLLPNTPLALNNLNMQGIRNEIDQDEIAICNPKDFFKTIDKRIIKLKSLMNIRENIYKIKFKKEPTSYEYTYDGKYEKLIEYIKRKSRVNVKSRLKRLNRLNRLNRMNK